MKSVHCTSTKLHFSHRCRCRKCKQYFTLGRYHAHSCISAKSQAHTSRRPRRDYVCRVCEKPYVSSAGLYQHMRNKHENKIPQKMCDICGKIVRCHTEHMRKHNGQKLPPRVCKICGKSFATHSNYFRHYNTLHLANQFYLCETCGKSFKCYNTFKVHERIHIGNKCHICPVCGKGFLEKSYMRKHLSTHDTKKRNKKS